MSVRIALPKGRLLDDTAVMLERAGWKLAGYDSSLRNYRLKSERFPELQIKVFQEKDIPVQVAIGNYDLGICGLDWIEELSSKYGGASLVRIKDLGYGKGALYAAGSSNSGLTLSNIRTADDCVRIASEYPNIAETFALDQRLRRFSVFPVWGAAEAYPPESSTLALVAGSTDEKLVNNGLLPLTRVLSFSAYLIANRRSWEQKDLSEILHTFENVISDEKPALTRAKYTGAPVPLFPAGRAAEDIVRIALPDGHQQKPAVEFFRKSGIDIEDYPSPTDNRRPEVRMDGVVAKVIRPQDMPLQVANNNFDLAITGHDWVTDHLTMFPSSPVTELLDLKIGWVRIVAVVDGKVNAENIYGVRQGLKNGKPFRVASEYINLADRYARENRLGIYRVIPTWGATEAFLPEDADLLIENTETGSTIARHNLKIVDTLFESTARLVSRKDRQVSKVKQARIEKIVNMFRNAVSK